MYKELLIKFMEGKSEKVEQRTGFKGYFLKADRKAVESWGEDDCEIIYLKLKSNIFLASAAGLHADTCIFCMESSITDCGDCRHCAYGKSHGVCGGVDSDYSKLKVFHHETYYALSNNFYRELIKSIEGDMKNEANNKQQV